MAMILGEIMVKFLADISDLVSGVEQATSTIAGVSDATTVVDELATSLASATTAVEELGAATTAAEKLGTTLSEVGSESASVTEIGTEVEATSSMFQQALATVSEFASGVREQMSQAASSVMDYSTKSKEALSQAFSKGASALQGFGSTILGAGRSLLNFLPNVGMAVFGIQSMVSIAGQLGGAFLGANASMEQTTTAFETMLGKGKATQDFLQQLRDFAAATPFEFPELATDAQKMLAFGFTTKEIIPTLTNIGDAMGAMGKSNADIERVVTVFGQMKAAGKVNAQDMMQLTSEGIPAWKMLADSMGLSISQVRALSQKGLLPADAAIKSLQTGMNKMFGGGMAAQAQTFNGLMSTFQDNATAAWRAFTGPLFDKAKTGLITIGNLVSSPQFAVFAQTMGKNVASAMDATGKALSTVGSILSTQLGPPIAHLGQVVGPLIQQFIAWAERNDVLGKAMSGVQAGISFIAGAIGGLITGLANTIQFFAKNQVALDILGAVLVGVGAGILAFAATAIPALVAGFIAWAIAAGSAAIATMAAAWPFILIGAVIAAVVLGIILAVQHWGQITSWLSGVWSAFSGWFMGAMAAIGNFFVGMWNGMVTGLRAAWNAILTVVKIGAIALLLLFTWPIVAIVALFLWLYNHNYYFKAMIDAIVNFVKAGIAWLVSAWQNTVAAIQAAWHYLVTLATMYFMLVYVTIQARIQQAQAFIHSVWTSVVSFLAGIWASISGAVSAMWGKISGFFSSAWSTYISGPLSSLWSSITGFVGGWAGQAVQWGKNLIQGFINGITGMIGNVGNAVQSVASKVAGFLGFHSPAREGPGTELDVWGVNLARGFAESMERGLPLVEASVNHLIQPTAALGNDRVVSTSALAGGSRAQSQQAAIQNHFHVYLDGQELGTVLAPHVATEIVGQARSAGPVGRAA
jgi:tape measure domain-containing protein